MGWQTRRHVIKLGAENWLAVQSYFFMKSQIFWSSWLNTITYIWYYFSIDLTWNWWKSVKIGEKWEKTQSIWNSIFTQFYIRNTLHHLYVDNIQCTKWLKESSKNAIVNAISHSFRTDQGLYTYTVKKGIHSPSH